LRISPVLHWELIAIARRERYYVIRWIYGIVLFVFIFGPILLSGGLYRNQELEHRRLAELNEFFFGVIMVTAGLAVLTLTPALVAGAIAEEKQRRGFEIVLTTTLSSIEIVLGKLLARMCQLVVILSLTVPVFCLLSLNGGVDVGLVVLGYLVTLTTGFLLATMAIAVSTLSTSPLRAVTATYLIELAWLLLPYLPDLFGPVIGPGAPSFSSWIRAGLVVAQQCVGMTNPFYVAGGMSRLMRPELVVGLVKMIALQLGVSALLILGSAYVFRPLALRAGSSDSRLKLVSFFLSRRTIWPRRACGDRPMLWKECHVVRTTVLARLITLLVVLGIAIPMGAETLRVSSSAFRELASQGYGALAVNRCRNELNGFLRPVIVLLYIAMTLFVAAGSALSFKSEFEKETWKSLIVTPLDAAEIVNGKILGSLWGICWLASIYLAFVLLGVAAGAVHPLAGALVVLEAAIFIVFAAVLGTRFSLASKSSFRALGGSLFVLLMINGGFLMCCFFVASDFNLFAITPFIQVLSLATYADVGLVVGKQSSTANIWIVLVILLSVFCYGVAAFALYRFCISHFELVADRPRRGSSFGHDSFGMVFLESGSMPEPDQAT
jgi:ABC-type transport system involved in multi-copper enzyme maturation permease subunit